MATAPPPRLIAGSRTRTRKCSWPAARLPRRPLRGPAARSSGSGDSTSTSLARDRMREASRCACRNWRVEAEVALRAVLRIPGDGKLDRREMDADLVRPAGLEPDVEERMRREESRRPRSASPPRAARPCRASVCVAIAAVAADGRVDPSGARTRVGRERARGTGARPRADESPPEARDTRPPSARRRGAPTCRGRVDGRSRGARDRRRRVAPSVEQLGQRAFPSTSPRQGAR